MTKKRLAYPWLTAIPLLLLVFGILMHVVIPKMHMRPDENWTYDYMPAPHPVALVEILTHDTHPPLWWLSFWSWLQLTGDHEITGRMASALFGMITLSLAYHLGRDWFGDWRYGVFALATLGTGNLFLIYTTEIRQYGLIYLLVLACMLAFRRWLRRRTWRTALRYGLFAALLMYIHYYLAFLIAAQLVFFVVYVFILRVDHNRPLHRIVLQAIAAGVLALLVWLPWAPVFVQQVLKLNRLTPAQYTDVGLIPATSPTNADTVLRLLTEVGNGLWWLPLLLLAWGLLRLWRRPAYWLLLTWALLPLAFILLLNTRVDVYTQRYVTFTVIGLLIACGVALAALPRYVRWLALLALMLNGLSYLPGALPQRVPFRDIIAQLERIAAPQDVFLFDLELYDSFEQKQILRYMPDELRARIVLQADDPQITLDQVRMWHVTDNLFAPEIFERFKTYEANQRFVTQIVGQCDRAWCFVLQLLETAPQQQPIDTFEDLLAYHGYSLQRNAVGRLTLTIWWRPLRPAPSDYAIGIYLLDASYQVVAQTDGMINDRFQGQVPLQNMDAGRGYYLDTRDLVLPPDLLSGTYYLAAAVYDWRTNSRLRLQDGSDTLFLDTLTLP